MKKQVLGLLILIVGFLILYSSPISTNKEIKKAKVKDVGIIVTTEARPISFLSPIIEYKEHTSYILELNCNGEDYELSLPYNPRFIREGETYNFEFLTKHYRSGKKRTKVIDINHF